MEIDIREALDSAIEDKQEIGRRVFLLLLLHHLHVVERTGRHMLRPEIINVDWHERSSSRFKVIAKVKNKFKALIRPLDD